MTTDHHPITVHFYRTHLGFDRVPKWHSRSRELIAALTDLQRKHFNRTWERASNAGIDYWEFIRLSKGHRIKANTTN